MKRLFLFAIALLFTAQFAAAQDWAKEQLAKSPRHREWVTVKHDGRSVDTLVVYPESKDKRPVVLVIRNLRAQRLGSGARRRSRRRRLHRCRAGPSLRH